jgi:mono/diheme cytochrome c family protein
MKRVLKWVGYIVGGFIVIVLLAVGTVYAITSSRMAKTYPTDVPVVPIPTDSASVVRGKHLVETVGKCQGCHGDNYAGTVFSDDAVFAKLTSANITSGKGGIAGKYTDKDWIRTLRYGVNPQGKSVIFMPSEAYTHFNDTDLGQVIAYLKTLPPADMTITPAKSIGPIGRAVYLAGQFPLLPASLIPKDVDRRPVPEGPTAEYGKYLVQAGVCQGCHGDNLGGSKAGDVATPNLTPSGELGKWTEADFVKAIRTGVRPDGRTLSTFMPWQLMKGLTDTELSAYWAYLHSLPPAPVKK